MAPSPYQRKLIDDCAITGMTVHEAARRAAFWWEKFRHSVREDFNKVRGAPRTKGPLAKGKGRMGAPSFVIQDSAEYVVPSGLLSGLAWDDLRPEEHVAVVYQWHRSQILEPLLLEKQTGTKH